MPELYDPILVQTLKKDRQFLEETDVPIVTVSASFKEDLKGFQGFPEIESIPDVVFSRAHYSMAIAIATELWKSSINPKKAWVVDPTNHVSHDKWSTIVLTETIGKTLARNPFLKLLKDFIDKFARQKLPILDSITPPLLYLTEKIPKNKAILSMHIAAGNILAAQGKKVVQVITDPHVRPEYVDHADLKSMEFCVFDEPTKLEFLEIAAVRKISADPNRIHVTGPPIDPRIIRARAKKHPWRSGPVKLCITTGGLGTNKQEITKLLDQLLPELRRRQPKFQVLVYASTHLDIHDLVHELAKKHHVPISNTMDENAKFRLLYHPQIVDANELLIKFGFPWAHGFITKPSGDMAYDAAASGSFLLTLPEWGVWEEHIREIFEQKSIARVARIDAIVPQLNVLMSSAGKSQSWIERAQLNAMRLESLFLNGTKEIVKIISISSKA